MKSERTKINRKSNPITGIPKPEAKAKAQLLSGSCTKAVGKSVVRLIASVVSTVAR